MDIGKEERTIIVTPVENPVPARETKPARQPARTPQPQRAPAPDKAPARPTRRPSKVPAR
jgi:hypothetical protein